ncbi:hypothetical protein VTO42DRAFT_8270 [Malbranchea cinnamomea]
MKSGSRPKNRVAPERWIHRENGINSLKTALRLHMSLRSGHLSLFSTACTCRVCSLPRSLVIILRKQLSSELRRSGCHRRCNIIVSNATMLLGIPDTADTLDESA